MLLRSHVLCAVLHVVSLLFIHCSLMCMQG